MGFVLGFLPWILYWVLVGNVDFRVAVCVPLAVAVGTGLVSRMRGQPWRSLEVGSLLIFVLLAAAAFVVNDAVLERWLQPLSNLGLFLLALVGVLIGRPFVREYAAAAVDAETAHTDGFRVITTSMTSLWVTVFAAMTIISAIPPFVDGSASIRDEDTSLSILCYWVLPFTLVGIAGVISGLFPRWFEKRSTLVDQRQVVEAPDAAPQPAPPMICRAGGSNWTYRQTLHTMSHSESLCTAPQAARQWSCPHPHLIGSDELGVRREPSRLRTVGD